MYDYSINFIKNENNLDIQTAKVYYG